MSLTAQYSLIDDVLVYYIQHRELAAAVASRCFFHLEEYDDALRLALGAGPHFDVSASSSTRSPAENLYVDTLVSKCIGEFLLYVKHVRL